jgi:hypothetical protein
VTARERCAGGVAGTDRIPSRRGREVTNLGDVNLNGRTWSIYDDTVIGYDKNGKEAVRVSVQQPFFERPVQYLNSI